MSKDWVNDIAEMHTKYEVNDVVRKMSPEKLRSFLNFRINFLQEELDELKKAAHPTSPYNTQDIVDACIDLCVVAIGTLNAYDVNVYQAWDEVHKANMSKEVGIKKERPNPLGLPDLIKPDGWQSPNHYDNVGFMNKMNHS